MYNQDIEQALIGALLVKPEVLQQASQLRQEHFYFADHAEIFQEIKRQCEKGRPNVLTVGAKLPQHKDLIIQAAANVITTVNTADYTAEIIDLYAKRQVATIAAQIAEGQEYDLRDLAAKIESLADEKVADLIAQPLDVTAALPPRQWVYGVHLIKNYTSMTVAPAGAGKSTIAIMDALGIATGKGLLGQHVHSQENVWYYNLEDPLEEMQRRIMAACQHHKITFPKDKVFVNSGRDRPLVVMQKSGNTQYAYPDKGPLIRAIKQNKIGVLIVDPFISAYEGDENNNKDVDRAIKAFNAVASECNCAIELIHHTGKGTQEGANAGRGASSMVGAVRSLRTIVTMTDEEAEKYGLDNPRQYIRIDGAKASMAPTDPEHRWMQLQSETLPNGDSVGVVAIWTPPSLFDGISRLDIQKCLEAIHEGREGGRFTMSARGQAAATWVGNQIMADLGVDDEKAKSICAIWLKSGLIYEQVYQNERRQDKKGVWVNLAKMADI